MIFVILQLNLDMDTKCLMDQLGFILMTGHYYYYLRMDQIDKFVILIKTGYRRYTNKIN